MCGVVGIHGPQEPSWIEMMNASILHRGPDDEGYYRDPQRQLSLAMRRLAIVDLAGGHQPMSTRDGRYTIVFNGEIYNAPVLREQLRGTGTEFSTDRSDTEIVLQLYAKHGREVLGYLNGMFAFAVFDREQETLFLARDRLGIKPLYYVDVGGRFAFASELKALLALPILERTLDKESLYHYMSLMYVPGERSIVRGVQRLPPGHSLMYSLQSRRVEMRKWWRPMIRPLSLSRSEWVAQLREGLEGAVRRWSLSDVPVGCSLSGGLDSSSIVALLARSGQRVRTYSLGFAGSGENEWNELPLARKVAEKWGTEHHEIVLDAESLLDDLLRMVWHLDEPYGGGLPSWSVFRFMSEDVKVAMTGSGGWPIGCGSGNGSRRHVRLWGGTPDRRERRQHGTASSSWQRRGGD